MDERAIPFCGLCHGMLHDAEYLHMTRCSAHGWSPWFVRAPGGRVLCTVCLGAACDRCQQTGLKPRILETQVVETPSDSPFGGPAP